MPIIAVQSVSSPHDIPVANSMVLVFQQLGGMIFIPIVQGIFLNKLLARIRTINPVLSESDVTPAGATALKGLVMPSDLPSLLEAYGRCCCISGSGWYSGVKCRMEEHQTNRETEGLILILQLT